jgi:hypothetical protein
MSHRIRTPKRGFQSDCGSKNMIQQEREFRHSGLELSRHDSKQHQEGNFATCWKVGQTEPLWSRKGNFLAFGERGWLVVIQPERHVEVCSQETGEVSISFDNVRETILNGDQFWLCKETNLEVWQQK